MTGLSGATIVNYTKHTVLKSGGDVERTRAQGEWIIRNASSALPTVFSIHDSGYVMERLTSNGADDVRVEDVVALLREYVWSRTPEANGFTTFYSGLHVKVSRILDNHKVEVPHDNVLRLAHLAYHGSIHYRALSHGDPTAENVMVRKHWGYVLIDPLPATSAVYDSPAVDVGKLLQSAYGWESVKGVQSAGWTPDEVREAIKDDALYSLGKLWAIIHIVRALPYITPDMRDGVLDVLDTALVL